MNKKIRSLLIWVSVFAIAMGFMESAVVVYLRTIYYPEGFTFPLRPIDSQIAITEFLREIATMIMLITVSLIAVKSALERFAVFIYSFAIWDLFYYIFLYLLLGWPPSLLTWDILFLIPVTWVGPVLAPAINSMTMILLAFIIIYSKAKHDLFTLKFPEWFLLITGSLITIFGYTNPYLSYLTTEFPLSELLSFSPSKDIINYSSHFIPDSFNWSAFILGEFLFLTAVVLIIFPTKSK